MMNTTHIEPFSIIGIAVRTSNEPGRAANDIPALWNTFLAEGILSKIPNRVDDTLYCLYTDYEKDFTKPYTTLLGCKVTNLDHIPEGLTGKAFGGGDYARFTAKGNIMDGIVFQQWTRIWAEPLPRAYAVDFEVYGLKAQNPADAEIDIFVGLN